MTRPATSDLTRAIDAVRRRWWIPVAAAVVGGLLGFLTTMGGGAATYQAVVATPNVRLDDVLGVISTNSAVPVDHLARELVSPETSARLGEPVKDAAISATNDANQITLRVTAPTQAKAQAAAEAYGRDVAARYDAITKAQLKGGLAALDANIAAIKALLASQPNVLNQGATNELTLEMLRREEISRIIEKPAPTPVVTMLSSGDPSRSTIVLLALAFAALAAGIQGVLALFDNKLRYRDDIERVTGPGSVVAGVGPDGSGWGLSSVISRLGKSGTVSVVPLSEPVPAGVRQALEAAGATLTSPVAAEGSGPDLTGPTLLLARLGVDRHETLDLSHRALSAAGGPFAGVVTATAKS